jgi:hypothetical protein
LDCGVDLLFETHGVITDDLGSSGYFSLAIDLDLVLAENAEEALVVDTR